MASGSRLQAPGSSAPRAYPPLPTQVRLFSLHADDSTFPNCTPHGALSAPEAWHPNAPAPSRDDNLAASPTRPSSPSLSLEPGASRRRPQAEPFAASTTRTPQLALPGAWSLEPGASRRRPQAEPFAASTTRTSTIVMLSFPPCAFAKKTRRLIAVFASSSWRSCVAIVSLGSIFVRPSEQRR